MRVALSGPLVLQKSSDYYRVYYMAGYITRGIIFNSLAVELNRWNRVTPTHEHPMWSGIPSGSRFYFVHSYHAVPARPDDIAAMTEYGHQFASVVAHDNLFAAQFHPEKSQHAGLQLLANFVAWNGDS